MPTCPPNTDDKPVDVGEPLNLTPSIYSGQIENAQNQAKINNEQINKIAPGYSGFFTVNETFKSNMFFWFIPSSQSAKQYNENAPVLLWLSGGPGGSSLLEVFGGSGPFSIDNCGRLSPRQYSWHKDFNVIYIDNPVGAGFSNVENKEGYAKNEIDIGNNLYEAIKQFFLLFPHLQLNDFYISGGSYAGKYVPALGHTIHTKNINDKPKINLKGLLINSGFTDPINQINYGDYFYQIGIIDRNARKVFAEYENQTINCINQKDYECAFNLFKSILITQELTHPSLYYNYTGLINNHNYLGQNYPPHHITPMEKYLNLPLIRRDLHVGNCTFTVLSHTVIDYLKLDFMNSVANWVIELLSHYRIMFYNGQLDVFSAYPLLENAIQKWNFTKSNEYQESERYIWLVDSEIAGYIKQGGNLTSVLVRNAGHGISDDQPKWALELVKQFLANNFIYGN